LEEEQAMLLKTKQERLESLHDGRVTYWDGKNGNITTHPKFRIPLEIAAGDYDHD
jgi:aromatic ring hydroxylase